MFRYFSSAAEGSARSAGGGTADAAVTDLGNSLEDSNEIACANALDMADFTCVACQQLLLHPVVVSSSPFEIHRQEQSCIRQPKLRKSLSLCRPHT